MNNNRILAYALARWDGAHGPDLDVRRQVQRLLKKPSSDVENYTAMQMIEAKLCAGIKRPADLAGALEVLNAQFGEDDLLNEWLVQGVVDAANNLIRECRKRYAEKAAAMMTDKVVSVLCSQEFVKPIGESK